MNKPEARMQPTLIKYKDSATPSGLLGDGMAASGSGGVATGYSMAPLQAAKGPWHEPDAVAARCRPKMVSYGLTFAHIANSAMRHLRKWVRIKRC